MARYFLRLMHAVVLKDSCVGRRNFLANPQCCVDELRIMWRGNRMDGSLIGVTLLSDMAPFREASSRGSGVCYEYMAC